MDLKYCHCHCLKNKKDSKSGQNTAGCGNGTKFIKYEHIPHSAIHVYAASKLKQTADNY